MAHDVPLGCARMNMMISYQELVRTFLSFMARDGVISLDTFLKTRKFKNGMGIIFLDRNVVSPVTSNSLKDKFSSLKHYRFSVILSAMEGKNKRLPTHEEYIEEYQNHPRR
ncbi:hypothetical protein IE984_05165 [Klebsiella pneumoniae]|nr:hypothetical protein [Klebsiella pneumoniae]